MDISTKPFYGIHTKPGMVINITLGMITGRKVCIVLTVTREPNSLEVEIIGLIDGKLVRFWLSNWTEYNRYV